MPFDFAQVTGSYLDAPQRDRIRQTTVGIAGAGGLGSNVAWMLVRSGFESLVIADCDVVEAGNLNRQFYFPAQLGHPKVTCLRDNLVIVNPAVRIQPWRIRLTAANIQRVFADCDVIVEALDGAEDKAMLAEQFAADDRLFVTASGLAGHGDADGIVTRWLGDTCALVGDTTSDVADGLPPLAPRVTIAAAKQADIVLHWVLSAGERGT